MTLKKQTSTQSNLPQHHTFEQALDQLPPNDDLPSPLPIVHLSIAKWFKGIAAEGKLKPYTCKIFGKEILYMFYGGVFYRPNSGPTRDASQSPIAFVFDPHILSLIERYFPFDTGAMKSGNYGDWSDKLAPFEERFAISGTDDYLIPSKIVHHIWGTNENYLRGHVNPDYEKMPEPIPDLCQFYNTDLTALGTDHRQCVIECQTTSDIPLEKWLLWIGYPESMALEVSKVYTWTKPYVPHPYPYSDHVIRNPAEIAAQLQSKAYEDIIHRYVKPFEN